MKYARECLIETQNQSEDDFSVNKAEDSLSNLEDAIWNLSKIPSLVEEAKERGVKMENRLIDYKSAIEDLGFTRVRE